ncbi:MAG: hypothetical protein ABFR62_03865 [Bacteroidota bacterium]
MKKITLLVIMLFAMNGLFAQATSQLNFGVIGLSYEIPVAENITIAPAAGTNLELSYLTAGVKANFYFDTLIDLPAQWDVYAGANAGYAFGLDNGNDKNNGNDSDFDAGLQVGGRWFWSEKWGIYLEFGGGHTSGGTAGLGLTMRL